MRVRDWEFARQRRNIRASKGNCSSMEGPSVLGRFWAGEAHALPGQEGEELGTEVKDIRASAGWTAFPH